MKKLVPVLSLCAFLFLYPGCGKKDEGCKTRPASSEAGAIQNYATAKNLTLTAHPSGLYYQVLDPGTGVTPTLDSKIYIRYTGKLLDANNTVFDQKSNSAETGWILNSLIDGWQVGIPLIKKGGHIILLVPSSMGYKCEDYYSIPGNSVLFFDIELVDVK
ncbi:MAG TPA: FKBP-type peptidyl-prolyl cis-trans isomerase [Chitinophagaceae bacterium]|nr:FKBP-type peptidyl-prolyl cis-trans isomerase [Chitinophagaceae bacterium]